MSPTIHPGWWRAMSLQDALDAGRLADFGPFVVCAAGRSDCVAEGLSEADARLTAAAPELLAALKALVGAAEYVGDMDPLAQAAYDAIAKAEGL